MNARTFLPWVAAAIALGLAVVFVVRGLGGSDGDVPAAPAEPAAAAAIQVPMVEAEPALPPMERAPWEQGTATMPPALAAAIATVPRGAAPATPDPEDIAASIATIREQSQRNVALVEGLLQELDALEKSGQAPPGLEFGALRENLEVARRAQALALELAESTQQPDSPAKAQRHQEIITELQQLQGRLRHDVMPQGLPGATGAP